MSKGLSYKWVLGAAFAAVAVALVLAQFTVATTSAGGPPDTPGLTDETPVNTDTPADTPGLTDDAAELPSTGTTQESGSGNGTPWVVAGLAALGVGVMGFAVMRQRRDRS